MSIGTSSANSLNSVEPDLICTSRIYFDSVTLTLHNVTLMSQNLANTLPSVITATIFFINGVYILSIKYRYIAARCDILLNKKKLHLFCWLNVFW